MEVEVKLNGTFKTARIEFAGKHDFGFLSEWRESLGENKNPYRVDSVDFGQLAVSRFEAHAAVEAYAALADEIADHISNNKNAEVAALALLKCDWYPRSALSHSAFLVIMDVNKHGHVKMHLHPECDSAPEKGIPRCMNDSLNWETFGDHQS
jgi:hypothetical protein